MSEPIDSGVNGMQGPPMSTTLSVRLPESLIHEIEEIAADTQIKTGVACSRNAVVIKIIRDGIKAYKGVRV